MNPVVAFDESGNTGQNLLDKTQLVFTLASVNLDYKESMEALDIFKKDGKDEPHFVNLKRRPSGQQKIIEFLKYNKFNSERIKVSAIHKPYMVTTKIVDLLIENLAKQDGIDLYERGCNIATSNLIHTIMPILCGKTEFEEFQGNFVAMMRKKPDSKETFYRHTLKLFQSCTNEDFGGFLATFIKSKDIIDRIIDQAGVTILDPAVPSFVAHCAHWGEVFNGPFDILHDMSKPIEHEKELLSMLMARDEKDVVIGYDIRKFVLPLKATGVVFADSKVVPQIQIADIFASAFAYWSNKLADVPVEDEFWLQLDDLNLAQYLINGIWPSSDVTPESLGTEEVGGINTVDYTSDLIERQRRKQPPRDREE